MRIGSAKITHLVILTLSLLSTACATFPGSAPEGRARALGWRPPSQPQDVALGMPMESVRGAWGEPVRIQVAGESTYGNERWIYDLGSAAGNGSQTARIVYFEGGRVAGWETTADF